MSISDELMARYYDLLLGRTPPDDMHPLEAKKQFALEIVRTYHSLAVAQKTLDEWNTRFSKRDLEHADLPAFSAASGDGQAAVTLVSTLIGTFSSWKNHTAKSRD